MCLSLVAQGLCAGALAEALFAGEARGPPETSAPYAVLEDAFHICSLHMKYVEI